MRALPVVLALSLAAACGTPDPTDEASCGPNKPCPARYTCFPETGKCLPDQGMAQQPGIDAAGAGADAAVEPSPDARPPADAPAPPDAAAPDAAVVIPTPDAAVAQPDARPAADAAPAIGPAVLITDGPADESVVGPAGRFTYATVPADPAAMFECAFDSSTYVACAAGGFPFSGLLDGSSHELRVRARDAAGPGVPAVRHFTVDAAGPVVTIAAPADGATTGLSVALVFTYPPEAGASFECRLDGDVRVVPGCLSGEVFSGLAPGAHALEVRGTDRLGNQGAPAGVAFTVVKPVGVAIVAPAAGQTTGPSGTILFTAGDSATVSCTLDGASVACGLDGSVAYTGLDEKPHTFAVTGDSGPPASVTWNVDATGPVVAITPFDFVAPDLGYDSCRFGTIEFACDPMLSQPGDCPPAGYSCSLDGAEPVACDEGYLDFEFPGDEDDSSHMVAVRARDVLGNLGPVATYSWEADSYGPTFAITSPADGSITAASGSISLDRGDAASVLACTVSGAGGFSEGCRFVQTKECSCPFEESGCEKCVFYAFGLAPPLDEAHNGYAITVQARDRCSNVALASADITVDVAPPTVGAIAVSGLGQGAAAMSFGATDSVSAIDRILCAMDPASTDLDVAHTITPAWHDCSDGMASYAPGDLGPGAHTFYVFAIDAAGRRSAPRPVDFDELYGPNLGRAILIGQDYSDPRTPGLLGAAASSAAFLQIGGAAARPIRVLEYVGPSANLNDVAGARAALPAGTVVTTMPSPSFLAEALRGQDVFLVHDLQDETQASALGSFWSGPLSSYLDAGGVAIVLDGTFGAAGTTPSKSYKLLTASGLLGGGVVASTVQVGATVSATCAVDDSPLRAGQPDAYTAYAGTVSFAITENDGAPVYHTGSDPRQAVVVDIVAGDGAGAVRAGASGYAQTTALFHDADGTLRAECALPAAGLTIHQLDAGGSVTLAMLSTTLANGVSVPERNVTTFVDVQPREQLAVKPPGGFLEEAYPDIGDVTVTLPGAVAGAVHYYVTNGCPTDSAQGCGSRLAESAADPLTLSRVCHSTYNVVAEALDANFRVMKQTTLSGVSAQTTGPLAMPAWQDPDVDNVHIVLGVPVDQLFSQVVLYDDSYAPYNETPGPRLCHGAALESALGYVNVVNPPAEVTLPFFTAAGFVGQKVEHTIVSNSAGSSSSFLAWQLPGTDVDLQYGGAFPEALLPFIKPQGISKVGTGQLRVAFTVDQPARLADTGGTADIRWDDETVTATSCTTELDCAAAQICAPRDHRCHTIHARHAWTAVLPARGSVTLPPLPDDLAPWRPLACHALTTELVFEENDDVRDWTAFKAAYPDIFQLDGEAYTRLRVGSRIFTGSPQTCGAP